MSTELEHEIVPAIRGWLAASSGVDVPTGLSREEARRRARELLAAIAAGSIAPGQVEVADDITDILWAAVEELDEKPVGQQTFEACDRSYQFVSAISAGNDPFAERDEILHRIARLGWRSSPGGLEAMLKARFAIWEHGDEERHRDVCANASHLLTRVEALQKESAPDLGVLREACWLLVKLSSTRPNAVGRAGSTLCGLLDAREFRVGCLDDREHLKANATLATAIANRHLGRWTSAETGHRVAAAAFSRTVDRTEIDRVESERLALQFVRESHWPVTESAAARIEALTVPRERIKSQVILANALLNADRAPEAIVILRRVEWDPAIEKEPALGAWLLNKLGTALSYLEKDAEAMEKFAASAAILARFHHPLQFADLTASLGEHLGKLGRQDEALALYTAARGILREICLVSSVGYLTVLIAELLMLLGRDTEAEAELLSALPLIERFELRAEAVAAVALLREAATKRRTDFTTIRQLREHLRKGLH